MPRPGNEPAEEQLARLRERVRAEAHRHQPDRDRIWGKVEAALSAPAPEPTPAPVHRWGALRVAAAAAGTAAVVTITSLAALELTGGGSGGTPARPIAQPGSDIPARSAESPSGTDLATPGPGQVARIPTHPVPPGTSPAMESPGSESGLLDITPSVDPRSSAYWAQNNLTLTAREPIDRLSVTIRVTRTRRVTPAGSWLNLPNADFRLSTELAPNVIVYRFILREGRRVNPGSYTFAAQYTRADDHNPRKDTYTVTGPSHTVGGNF